MSRVSTDTAPSALELTSDQAVTLRRVAFGESEVRTLRAADITRLLALRLIERTRDGLGLTAAGRQHYEALPRTVFAARPRRDEF